MPNWATSADWFTRRRGAGGTGGGTWVPDLLILFVGQMDWKKNILTVLEACAEMKKAGVSFRLLLAGQGMDMKAIGEKIHDLNSVRTGRSRRPY